MTNVTLPDPETLPVDSKLSDDQLKMIDEVKSQPWEKTGPAKGPAKDIKDPEPEKKEDVEAKTPEQIAADKALKDAEAVETQRLEKRAKELTKTVDEVKQIEVGEKAEQERLEKIAKDEGITVDQAKEDFGKDKTVAERHGNDPVKIARALRKEQSEYGKLKGEVEELRELKAKVEAESLKFNEENFNAKMEAGREDIIEKYREKFPEDGEISDDAAFERGRALIRKGLEERQKTAAAEVSVKAKARRTELLSGLAEEFKDYSADVNAMLSECGDDQILDKGFDVVYLANYARGKKYTPDYVKSLTDAAYQRGVEQPAMIPRVPAGKGSAGKDVLVDLTNKQKARAEEIYGRRDGWTKEQMYAEYAKVDKERDDKW